ncbi:MAG: inositol monophosphatase [Alphaproteobacteria bacterium]|nr:inositol monophosphatase [Alphaproteobacteria bacterium]
MALQSPVMSLMIKAAEKAAKSLVRDFGEVEQLQVSRKGPADFVTAADKRSEEIIFEELKRVHPDYSFLMEESGEVKGADTENKWIIDPLDGTHNFMHGIPQWSISIALEQKGQIIAGLVYDPIKFELFRAEKGMGAFLAKKRLRVSGRSDFESAVLAIGYPNPAEDRKKKLLAELDVVCNVAPMIRRFGSAALDMAYVAAGRFDGFWERGLKPWDAAAGSLIVKEAGGYVTSIDNDDNPTYSRHLVCGNPAIHTNLRKLLKSVV